MGRYLLIIRYVISIICISLMLWGFDRSDAAPLKPLVVRKKIVVPKDKTATVHKEKTDRAVETAKVTKPEKKTAPPITEKSQLAKTKPSSAKPGKDKATLIVKKITGSPAPQIDSKSSENKKPAIKPKTEISAIKQAISIQPSAADEKMVVSDNLIADNSKTFKTLGPNGMPTAYDPTDKIDPFEPLFKEKSVSIVKKKRKKRIPRTPLERIDLSQLKLVGIIMASSGNRALVEEATGKGYVIKKGTYIGTSSGKVVKIKKEKVIVEEEFEDAFGKIEIRKREIKLPKPSGEL